MISFALLGIAIMMLCLQLVDMYMQLIEAQAVEETRRIVASDAARIRKKDKWDRIMEETRLEAKEMPDTQ